MAGNKLAKSVLKFVESAGKEGANKSEIARGLEITPKQRANMRKVIQQLLEEGALVLGKKGRFRMRQKTKGLLVGTIRIQSSGGAWFYIDREDTSNLKSGFPLEEHDRMRIGPRSLHTALDGDKVLVKWLNSPEAKQRRKSREAEEPIGRVEKVIERRKGSVIGTLRKFRGRWIVETDDANMPPDIQITDIADAKEGQKVAVRIVTWDARFPDPLGEVSSVLGWPDDPGVDILGVIEKHGLRVKFSQEVLDEAQSIGDEVDSVELERRRDWRDKMVITIDPKDAKDHDDAVWVERNKNGWTLAVHIADVSHYVKPGTAMDKEAVKRGNSTYLVDRVLPMLPEHLSNGICSLKPHVERLTKCCIMTFSKQGVIQKAVFEDAVICSPAKLSYEQAQEMLDKGDDSELGKLVKESWNLASLLRKNRFKKGALDLDFPEVRVILDKKKKPVEVKKSEHSESHQLIEEFMLVANEAVAKAIKDAAKPAIYRIHEDPDPDRLLDFAETAIAHGYKPGDLTNKKHIQNLLDAAKGKPEEHAIKLGLLKSLNRAAYSPEPLGHYGLSKENYCHFTSPIRRYADLIVHRALQPLLENSPKIPDKTPSFAKSQDVSRRISTTERTSAEAENETHKMKMLEYLEDLSNSDTPKQFKAIVTEVRPSGLFVEAMDLLQKGMIKREDIGRGNWQYDRDLRGYVSRNGQEKIILGQHISVFVKHIDRERGFIDFAYAE